MTPGARIRAVVFDFGGVLITSLTNQVGTLAGRHDTSLEEMLGIVIGPRDSGEHPWHRAERGELTVDEIQDLLAPRRRPRLGVEQRLQRDSIHCANQLLGDLGPIIDGPAGVTFHETSDT